ncbi:MAG: hypothetical protein H8D46_03920 [FCB group bacterium]|nr:hypothetical protein [FCB group bacterium]
MTRKRTPAFWFITIFIALSIVLMLVGQTMSVINYDFTVRYGLQESVEEVSEFGVQVNRAFGVGDTLVFVPLLIVSIIGLWLRKRWALLMTTATAAVSAYWSVTILFILLWGPGCAGYNYAPGAEIWTFVLAYTAFGFWCTFYVLFRGEKLIQ